MADKQLLQDVKVLFVDDAPDITEVFGLCLQLAGAEVKVASSAQEALEACGDWSPDILISDLTMPKINGYDLILALRASQQSCKDIPAIALSGMADLNKAIRLGFTTGVQKPVDPDDLIQVIAKVLSVVN